MHAGRIQLTSATRLTYGKEIAECLEEASGHLTFFEPQDAYVKFDKTLEFAVEFSSDLGMFHRAVKIISEILEPDEELTFLICGEENSLINVKAEEVTNLALSEPFYGD